MAKFPSTSAKCMFTVWWACCLILIIIVAPTTPAAQCVFDCAIQEYCGSVPFVIEDDPYAEMGLYDDYSVTGSSALVDLSHRGITSIATGGLECALFANASAFDLSHNSFAILPPLSAFFKKSKEYFGWISFSYNLIVEIPVGYFNATENDWNTLNFYLDYNLITSIKPGLFPEFGGQALTLYLRNNAIASLEKGVFTLPGFLYSMTLNVQLANNSITSLGPELFSGFVGSFLGINLGNNNITKIDPTAFVNFQGLNLNIFMENNQMSAFAPNTFNCSLQSLTITMNYNLISELSPNMFRSFSGDELTIFLNFNFLTTLKTGLFTASSVSQLSVYLNKNNIVTLEPGFVDGFVGASLLIETSYNQLTMLPSNLFQGFAGQQLDVDLNHNKIATLEQNVLQGITGKHLYLFLNHNLLTQFTEGILENCGTEYVFVFVNNNSITTFEDFALSGFTGQHLNISLINNSLQTLNNEAVVGFAGQFLTLYLNRNRYTTIDANTFEFFGGPNLVVYLNDNAITYLSPGTFAGFSQPFLTVFLTNNSITRLDPGTFANFTGDDLTVYLTNNSIATVATDVFLGFEGTGLAVFFDNNNISSLQPDFASGVSNNKLSSYLANNPLKCSTYAPRLKNCTCTRPHESFYSKCNYGVCSSESLDCRQGTYPTSSCAYAPRSQCISQCSNTSEYMKVAPGNPPQAICFPKTQCNVSFPKSDGSGYFTAYQFVEASTTTNRLCKPCTQCPTGFTATICTDTQDSVCHLSSGNVAAIVLSTLAGVVVTLALCRWGVYHKTKKEESLLSYVLQSETLEMTTKLLTVEEKKVKDTEQSWQIHWSDLELGELLGRGAFGVVNRASWLGSFVAVKVLEVNIELLDVESSAFEREVAAMQSLHHPNLVTFYGFGTTSAGKPFLVSELMNQTLRERLRANKTKFEVDWSEARRWCADIVAGMLFLHTRTPPMVHRDLKSDNCLLGENDIVKIADFGTVTRPSDGSDGESMFTSSATPSTSLIMSASIGAGTPLWMAPEVMSGLHGISHYGLSVDVYSFGMVMYEIATQQLPFCPECDAMDQFEFNDFVIGGGRPQVKTDLPQAYVELMEMCWSNDPESRPMFTQLSPMFAKMDLQTMSSLLFGSAKKSS